MESLFVYVLVLIASVSTIAGLAITAILLLVIGEMLALIYQSLFRPGQVAHARN